jgi:LL-diaminopimelate aminotransferase
MIDYSAKVSRKLGMLPPYLFARIDRMKQEAVARGIKLIDLGIGDPDTPTPEHIIAAMDRATREAGNHRYPSYEGKMAFRTAVTGWYRRRFGVELDPANEALTLIGSKEGIGHIPFAFLDPGDVCLVPNPGYPVYRAATLLAGGEPYDMPLLRENRFLPDLDAIPPEVARRAKLMFVNYPNNPTAATAGEGFFRRVVDFAREYGIALCSDAAYSEMYYDEAAPPAGIFSVPGAKEVAIEFHSLSKTYNMTGWRIGFAVGNAQILGALGKIKSNVDSGAFGAVQDAGIAALDGSQDCVAELRTMYRRRRDVFCAGLKKAGFTVDPPEATFYVWIPVPAGRTSEDFAALLLDEAGLVLTPGNGFGSAGEGYVRAALCLGEDRLEEAAARLAGLAG